MSLITRQVTSFDTETTGLSPYKGAEIFSYSIGYWDGSADIRRIDGKDRDKNLQHLQDYFLDTSIVKCVHNFKFDRKFVRFLGIEIPEDTYWDDTMFMSQLLRNLAFSHGLDHICHEFGPYKLDTPWGVYSSLDIDKRTREEAKTVGMRYDKIDPLWMYYYQLADAQRGILAYRLMYDKIIANEKLFDDYRNEIALGLVADEMEDFGLKISRLNSFQLVDWLNEELEKVQDETYDVFGEYYNFNSPDQVNYILFDYFGIPIQTRSRKTGKPKSDKDILLKLRDEYEADNDIVNTINLIFKQRSYTKGLANVTSYLELADENDILHPNIWTNKAKTGRLASDNPNLMNVSKEGVLKNPYAIPARKCFCTRVGSLLYLLDYSGIELRLIIEVSRCLKMIELMQAGQHPHIVACYLFYNKFCPEGFVFTSKSENKDLYGAGKNAHFALAYGAALKQFCKTLNLSLKHGKIGYEMYAQEFPEIAYLTQNIAKSIIADGYVTTPFGRDLYVTKDKAYAGLNYLIQGTAAGILKRAMVRVDRYFKEQWDNYADTLRIVLSIHDEIIINFPRALMKKTDEIMFDIQQIMISMDEIKVPLDVEAKRTFSTWDKAEEYLFKK